MDIASLGAYLDEVDDDPVRACTALPRLGIKKVCLRRAWAANITTVTDSACQAIMQALRKNGLDVAVVCSNIGSVPPAQLGQQTDALRRGLLVANYYKAPFLRVHAGTIKGSPQQSDEEHIRTWLEAAAQLCQDSSVIPLLELTPDSPLFDHHGLSRLLGGVGTWKVLYDPANLVLQRNQDPLIYLDALREHIAAIDLHDFEIGVSVRPVGTGSCRWPDIIVKIGDWTGPLLIESGLGRRYGPAETRRGTFVLAHQAAMRLLGR